jgi:transmembrane sensor
MRNEDKNLMVDWLDDIISHDDNQILKSDIDLEQTAKELSFLDDASLKSRPIEQSWNTFEKRLQSEKPKPNNSKKLGLVFLALLMSLIGYFGYQFYNKNKIQEHQTKRGEIYAGMLPDGSSFHLNTLSIISFVPGQWSKNRLLQLEGQAYFEVKEGEKFIVKTKNGQVKVYGTQFDVKSYSDHITVTCYEGKVGVIDPKGNEKHITNQQQISIYKGIFTNIVSINTKSSDWKSGHLIYNNQNIQYVIQDLEKHYDISFELTTQNKNKYFTGQIALGDLKKSLDLLCIPLNITYEIDQKTVKL